MLFKTTTSEAAVAFEHYTNQPIQLTHLILKRLAYCLIEIQPRFEAATSAWALASVLHQAALSLSKDVGAWPLLEIVPVVAPTYVAKADLYRAFDAMKLMLRTLGLTPAEQASLFKGEAIGRDIPPYQKAWIYRGLDSIEYTLLGWAAKVLQHPATNKTCAAQLACFRAQQSTRRMPAASWQPATRPT